MNPADYEFFSQHVLHTSGLSLGTGKEYLLEARLVPLANSWGLNSLTDLIREIRGGNATLAAAVTEAMTTNETSFFRDRVPFDELRDTILPPLISARLSQRRLRIWCAASSTGQEPYSLAMLLRESFPQLDSWSIDIVATDISRAALDRARAGVYSQFEVQRGLPIQLVMKYFVQHDGGWQVREDLRKLIQWHQINLLDDFSRFGLFDVILCRNVLIYFTNETKGEILKRMSRRLQKDGSLILGAAETVLGICDAFRKVEGLKSAVYIPAVGAAA